MDLPVCLYHWSVCERCVWIYLCVCVMGQYVNGMFGSTCVCLCHRSVCKRCVWIYLCVCIMGQYVNGVFGSTCVCLGSGAGGAG